MDKAKEGRIEGGAGRSGGWRMETTVLEQQFVKKAVPYLVF